MRLLRQEVISITCQVLQTSSEKRLAAKETGRTSSTLLYLRYAQRIVVAGYSSGHKIPKGGVRKSSARLSFGIEEMRQMELHLAVEIST
jgi:hypothetical protein